jgi:hypothetical protein
VNAQVVAIDQDVVTVDTPIGRLTAFWFGPEVVPGDICDVELSIDSPLIWGNSVFVTSDHSDPSTDSAQQMLVGTALSLDEELLCLEVGPSFVFIAVEGVPPPVLLGRTIAFDASSLSLYDTNT